MTDEQPTEQLGRIRGVSWQWRDDAPDEAKEQPGIGVIAQEVEAVFPELVTIGPDGIRRVDYIGLIGPLIEAVRELDDRVRTLEAAAGHPPAAQPPSRRQPPLPAHDPADPKGTSR